MLRRTTAVRGLGDRVRGEWLDIRRFEEHNSVDRTRFPSFDDELRRSMFEEPMRLFIECRGKRPLVSLTGGA